MPAKPATKAVATTMSARLYLILHRDRLALLLALDGGSSDMFFGCLARL